MQYKHNQQVKNQYDKFLVDVNFPSHGISFVTDKAVTNLCHSFVKGFDERVDLTPAPPPITSLRSYELEPITSLTSKLNHLQ